jgi:hypothetical protein
MRCDQLEVNFDPAKANIMPIDWPPSFEDLYGFLVGADWRLAISK